MTYMCTRTLVNEEEGFTRRRRRGGLKTLALAPATQGQARGARRQRSQCVDYKEVEMSIYMQSGAFIYYWNTVLLRLLSPAE